MDTSCQTPWQRLSVSPRLGLVVMLTVGSHYGAVAAEWKFDVMKLKNGRSWCGLLVEETPTEVRFQCVHQLAGERTWVFEPAPFQRNQIDAIERLTPQERNQLSGRLRELKAADPNGKEGKNRWDKLKLIPEPRGGWRFESEQFVLVSNAKEAVVREAAIRLEDIFAAYSVFLPPRRRGRTPTEIQLYNSKAEYELFVKGAGLNFSNLAFFDRDKNQIVCGSDLKVMGESLTEMELVFGRFRADEHAKDLDLDKQYGKGKGPESFRLSIRNFLLSLDQKERENWRIYQLYTQRLFQTLYHEAFHAYLDNYVYDRSLDEVPLWLNEGLAQIFETAIVEAGELRVGHADKARLMQAKEALAKEKGWVPLPELLQAGPKNYLALHGSDQKQAGDRYYLTAWALAFYLTFDRNILGTPRLDKYVAACKRGANPLDSFRVLVDQRLPEFESAFQEYIRRLQPDGTVKIVATPR